MGWVRSMCTSIANSFTLSHGDTGHTESKQLSHKGVFSYFAYLKDLLSVFYGSIWTI